MRHLVQGPGYEGLCTRDWVCGPGYKGLLGTRAGISGSGYKGLSTRVWAI